MDNTTKLAFFQDAWKLYLSLTGPDRELELTRFRTKYGKVIAQEIEKVLTGRKVITMPNPTNPPVTKGSK